MNLNNILQEKSDSQEKLNEELKEELYDCNLYLLTYN